MSQHFDDEALRDAYAPILRERTTAHTPDCPSESELLLAARGQGGDEAERLRVLDHALRCPACRPELALLHSVVRGEAGASAGSIRELSWRRWMPVALAASLVLAVGVAGIGRLRARSGDEVTRGVANGPALVAPAGGSAVRAGLVRFTWRPVSGALRYTLELDANDGTVLYSARTADTVLTAPIAPTAVGENRWLVRAHMDDGSERRSDTRVLRVR